MLHDLHHRQRISASTASSSTIHFVLRAFHIPIGRIFAGLAFALPCSANLLRGIAGIHFAEHIADRGKLTFAACAVNAVINANETNAKLRKNSIGIHSHLEIIAPEAAHAIYDDALDPSCLDADVRTVEYQGGIMIPANSQSPSPVPTRKTWQSGYESLCFSSQTTASRRTWMFSYGSHPRGKTGAFFAKIITFQNERTAAPDMAVFHIKRQEIKLH